MASVCLAAIHLCLARITRLDATGEPTAGPNNSYVTDNPITLGVSPQIVAGEEQDLVGGCDCIIVSYKGNDKLKRFDLEFDVGLIEFDMLEMMLGATAQTVAATVEGIWWPSQLSCADSPQPNVAFEAWQDTWQDDHPGAAPRRYIHWLWGSTRWQIGDATLENDFTKPKLNGFTRSNPNWGLGIYGDQLEALPAGSPGGVWYTDTLPDAECGYQSHAIT